ncbi:hypothetical protein Mapa_017071 [Marchantia paleacea]|nr:hypothetical protein Mapa_017071 [Marchantia paleacea]
MTVFYRKTRHLLASVPSGDRCSHIGVMGFKPKFTKFISFSDLGGLILGECISEHFRFLLFVLGHAHYSIFGCGVGVLPPY